MEEGLSRKEIIVSEQFIENRQLVYEYGIDTFGYFQAERYNREIEQSLSTLSEHYLMYPECRHLATKSRMYRNIILDAHLIVYRVIDHYIEVLDIIHQASSIRKIRQARNIGL